MTQSRHVFLSDWSSSAQCRASKNTRDPSTIFLSADRSSQMSKEVWEAYEILAFWRRKSVKFFQGKTSCACTDSHFAGGLVLSQTTLFFLLFSFSTGRRHFWWLCSFFLQPYLCCFASNDQAENTMSNDDCRMVPFDFWCDVLWLRLYFVVVIWRDNRGAVNRRWPLSINQSHTTFPHDVAFVTLIFPSRHWRTKTTSDKRTSKSQAKSQLNPQVKIPRRMHLWPQSYILFSNTTP